MSRATDEVCQGATGLSSFQISMYLLLRCPSTLHSTFVTLIRSNDQINFSRHCIQIHDVSHPRPAVVSQSTGPQSFCQHYSTAVAMQRSRSTCDGLWQEWSAEVVWTIHHYTCMCDVKWRWYIYYLDTDRHHRRQAKDAQHMRRMVGPLGWCRARSVQNATRWWTKDVFR